ncbi:hypothetical protein FZ103_04425 [Streptomonospora sp. PA3]|uniref:hypothetical protein n=1 Tax=Streptomonospora sp. PA3 TaxID=2607326 RepID=UPI0012DC2BF4|nr:hypothetical protein [Streptomonospora sp. PA3]MUL40431.1 hypothetical protein [Streptomonospora sp. PA3]
MMDLLRSRMTMVVLAAVVTVALVATGAIGLFDALSSPDSGRAADGRPPGTAASPVAAPKLESLGKAPQGASYTDFGQQCPDVECVRIVGVSVADGGEEQDSDKASKAAIDKVFNHLLDKGWARVLPNSEADPKEVPLGESYLTDGQVLITATPVNAPDASAGLMLMHAQRPGSS